MKHNNWFKITELEALPERYKKHSAASRSTCPKR